LPRRWPAPQRWPRGLDLDALALLPRLPWADGFQAQWSPGEAGAAKALRRFLDHAAEGYNSGRDRPDQPGTSRLSPHLHFGELSPQQLWQATEGLAGPGPAAFRRELAWREFSHHLLHHFPRTVDTPLRLDLARLPWRRDPAGLKAWQQGRTGYPIVDAGMRELWATGFMHNRVRMIAASFLVKDLLVDWRLGAAWFMDTLLDADLAQNSLGWQWVAGCGADAAPFFRIFNPTLQAQKFDPQGAYIRRWIPELGTAAYPSPIVDHALARQRALEALASLKKPARA
jgi:deoxyribodipyrimidine photo-lyase